MEALMNILIMTPLQRECDFFIKGCAACGFASEGGENGRLAVMRLPELNISVACGGVGKVQFAVQTQHLLERGPGWDLVICAGAAGGLADEVAVGDVVIGTTTIEHDYKNRFHPRPSPRFEGDPATIESLRQVALLPHDFEIHFGLIASGDEDIVDDARRAELRQQTGALAVAWEGAGGARAAKFSGVPYLEIRGVTDAANHEAAASFETNLEIAMNNVAALITAWLNLPEGAAR
jgi:adenosylhomocysteine nucleosidase